MDPLGALTGLLGGRTGNMPNWIWIVVIGGGVGIYLLSRKGKLGTAAAAQDTGNPSGATGATTDPAIDPNTGVPYAVEEMTNPQTGVPFYYSQGSPAVTSGQPDYAAILAALQDIDNKIGRTQGNPSGQGGVVGIGANPGPGIWPGGSRGGPVGTGGKLAMQQQPMTLPPRSTAQPVMRRF